MTSWQGIDEFLAVVEAGSFTRAAEALGASKSYVSKVVSDLEARLGAQLMVRTTRRLSLTAAGELFFERCRTLRGELDDIERTMSQFQSRPVGRLRIALSDTFGSDYMSALLADFSYLHRDIAIEAIVYLREADLVQERFDVVIRYGALENSSAHARLFGYMSYCICAAPDYVAEHGWPASPRDLARHNCLTSMSGQFLFNDGSRVRVSGNWSSNSGIALRWATRHGLGLANLPISVVRNDILDGRILAMQDDWTFYDQEVSAVFPSGIMPTATRAFIDYLTAHFNLGKTRPSISSLRALSDRLQGWRPPGADEASGAD
jgi:LysR family transcriptional activator of dmlA